MNNLTIRDCENSFNPAGGGPFYVATEPGRQGVSGILIRKIRGCRFWVSSLGVSHFDLLGAPEPAEGRYAHHYRVSCSREPGW